MIWFTWDVWELRRTSTRSCSFLLSLPQTTLEANLRQHLTLRMILPSGIPRHLFCSEMTWKEVSFLEPLQTCTQPLEVWRAPVFPREAGRRDSNSRHRSALPALLTPSHPCRCPQLWGSKPHLSISWSGRSPGEPGV